MHWQTSSKVIFMQSLKKLAWTVYMKKPTIRFLSNKESDQISPLNMYESKKINISLEYVWKSKINGIFTTCSVYFTILQSLNSIGQEHKIFSHYCLTLLWPLNKVKVTESVKLSVWYHHPKFDIYGIWENPNVKVFDKPGQLANQNHANYLPWTHTSLTQFILCMIFLMYVAIIQHLNCSRQESKK